MQTHTQTHTHTHTQTDYSTLALRPHTARLIKISFMIEICSATIELRWVASQKQFSHCLEIHSVQVNLLLKKSYNPIDTKTKD